VEVNKRSPKDDLARKKVDVRPQRSVPFNSCLQDSKGGNI